MALADHDTKRCTRCNQIKPRTTEYFRSQGKGALLRSVCIECFNAGRRARRTNREYPHKPPVRRTKPAPVVRVVEDGDGNRRALRYWEDGPGDGERWVGVGSELLRWSDSE